MLSLPPSLIVRPVFSGYSTPELKDRHGEQSEAPVIPGEMAADLLHHLDIDRSAGGILTRRSCGIFPEYSL